MLKVIAVDFDGCLCENKWPDIGEPHEDVIQALLDEQFAGAKLILWTCRTDEMLEAAIEWCKKFSLEFDAFNSNLPESIEYFQSDSRKVWATEYWDDKAVAKPAPVNPWRNPKEELPAPWTEVVALVNNSNYEILLYKQIAHGDTGFFRQGEWLSGHFDEYVPLLEVSLWMPIPNSQRK